MLLRTAPFSLTARAYTGPIAARLFWRLWWLWLLPVGVIVAGALTDWRIALLGLMLVFVVYPAVLTIALLGHAMRPDVVARSLATGAEIADDGTLTLRLPEAGKELTFPAVRSIDRRGRYISLTVGPKVSDIVLIPADAVPPESLALLRQALTPVEYI